MNNKNLKYEWLTSAETQKKLKVSACKLMHLRTSGTLEYKKNGNSFLYKLTIDHKNE